MFGRDDGMMTSIVLATHDTNVLSTVHFQARIWLNDRCWDGPYSGKNKCNMEWDMDRGFNCMEINVTQLVFESAIPPYSETASI